MHIKIRQPAATVPAVGGVQAQQGQQPQQGQQGQQPEQPEQLGDNAAPTVLGASASVFGQASGSAGQIAAVEGARVATCVPAFGYVTEHVAYGLRLTDCPGIYHVGAAIEAIATLVSDVVSLEVRGTPVPLHLWTLLIGRSQLDRKTTAARLTERLVSLISPERILPEMGSPEGLLDHLGSKSACALVYRGEFGSLLGQMESSYWRHAPDLLMSLYDADVTTVFRRRLTSKMEKGKLVPQEFVIARPNVSLLAACALGLLESRTRGGDWTGGFFRRMLILYGVRRRFQSFESREVVTEDKLLGLLKQVVDFSRGIGGVLTIKPAAFSLYERWARKYDPTALTSPQAIQGILGDAPSRALRISGLFALSKLQSVVDVASMRSALALTMMSCHTVRSVVLDVAQIGGDPDLLLRARILQALDTGPRTISSLIRYTRAPGDRQRRVIASLEEEERVEVATVKHKGAGRPLVLVSLKAQAGKGQF